jgi:hypothetical protein
MKITHILSILIAISIAITRLEGSESEVLAHVAKDPVTSKLVADFDFFPKLFAQADSQSKDETQQNDRFFTTYTLLAASRSNESKLPSQGWSHWVEVRLEKSASSEFMNVRSLSFTALRRGDSWPCFLTDKVIRLDERGEVTVVLTSEQKQAEQAGTGQPATRSQSKSEGDDKPQPEAEGRSR